MSPKPQAITNSSSILVDGDHFAHATVPAMHKETKETDSKSSQLTDLQIFFCVQPRDNNLELPVQWSLKAAYTTNVSASANKEEVCGSMIEPRKQKGGQYQLQ